MKLFNNYIIGAIRIILGIYLIYSGIIFLVHYPFHLQSPLDYEDYGKIIGALGASLLSLVFIIYNLTEGFQNLNNQNLDAPKLRLFSITWGLLFLLGGVISLIKSIEYIYPILSTFLYYTAFFIIAFEDFKLYKNRNLKTI